MKLRTIRRLKAWASHPTPRPLRRIQVWRKMDIRLNSQLWDDGNGNSGVREFHYDADGNFTGYTDRETRS